MRGKINKKKLERATKGSGGVISTISKNLGVHRGSLNRYLKKHPEQKSIVEDERNLIYDLTRHRIYQAIKDNDMVTIRWFADRVIPEFKTSQMFDNLEDDGDLEVWSEITKKYSEVVLEDE